MGFKDIKSIFVGIRRILRGSMKDQENSLRRLRRSGEEDDNKCKNKDKNNNKGARPKACAGKRPKRSEGPLCLRS